jgi:hypothetical protein
MSSTVTDQLHLSIAEEGRLLANAVIFSSDPSFVQASLHVEPGPLPAGTCRKLVDAVLDLSEAQTGTSLQASFALGEAELLDQMRQRCREVDVRAAGASCLFTGVVANY